MPETRFESVIGLEVHIQLNTLSKAFCGDDASFGGSPNSHTSVISLAHPGTLPKINKKQVEYAIRLGLALQCEINENNYFDRKHYFYADLPKGFQTTQDNQPICKGGHLLLRKKDGTRKIRIHHIHMEEDAGKSLHHLHPSASLLDFNRAGVPLLELVTEPELHNSEEVYIFINQLRQLVRYLEISDGNMEEGSLRCDVNVSIRPKGTKELNNRCEIKNINSARFARKAVDYEIVRQIAIIERGEVVKQQTREYIPEEDKTRALRGKEHAHDYRYFPEPDLPPVVLLKNFIDRLKKTQPELPDAKILRFQSTYELSLYDAELLAEQKEIAREYEDIIDSFSVAPKPLANVFINKILPYLSEQEITIHNFPLSYQQLVDFLHLIEDKKITTSIAYQQLWPVLLENPGDVNQTAVSLNILQTSDEDQIMEIARVVVIDNPEQVKKYLQGKKSLMGFFMGQLMRKSNGKANPKIAQRALQNCLEEIEKAD